MSIDRTPKALDSAPLGLCLTAIYGLLYRFRPSVAFVPGTVWFPSVDAMMIVFPDELGPKSFERSTVMVRMFFATLMDTFFMVFSYASVS